MIMTDYLLSYMSRRNIQYESILSVPEGTNIKEVRARARKLAEESVDLDGEKLRVRSLRFKPFRGSWVNDV